jgi:hypothetical protein
MGDSLRRSIDKGLNHARYGLVVLSPAFFSKEWYKERELDALTTRETGGRKSSSRSGITSAQKKLEVTHHPWLIAWPLRRRMDCVVEKIVMAIK